MILSTSTNLVHKRLIGANPSAPKWVSSFESMHSYCCILHHYIHLEYNSLKCEIKCYKLAFKYIGFERTRLDLFQKRVVRTTLAIYFFFNYNLNWLNIDWTDTLSRNISIELLHLRFLMTMSHLSEKRFYLHISKHKTIFSTLILTLQNRDYLLCNYNWNEGSSLSGIYDDVGHPA